MHWADETPGFWEKLADSGRFHLGEVLASVNAAEMGQVPDVVQLICHDREACGLLQVKLGSGHKVSGGQEVFELLANACLAIYELLEVV